MTFQACGSEEAKFSGTRSYEPFLHVECAELAKQTADEVTRHRELREAHRLFTEIGAPIRAAEVAKELGLATFSRVRQKPSRRGPEKAQ